MGIVRKSYSRTPCANDADDNLYTVNADHLSVKKYNIENSKPGQNQGRKAMGLK